MPFDQKYMFKVNNVVVIQHKGPGGGWAQFGSVHIMNQDHGKIGHNGKKADFVGERVSDVRRKKGQKNIHDKKLSKQEKQDNVIVIVQSACDTEKIIGMKLV